MHISDYGMQFLKNHEGCKLTAYRLSYQGHTEKYYTIGYGHYGSDVKPGMVWTQAQAERQFKQDLESFEKNYVDKSGLSLNQHQYDALVCFAYNIPAGCMSVCKLIKANASDAQIKAKWLAYNKAGGQTLSALSKRRQWECDLYFTPMSKQLNANDIKGKTVYTGGGLGLSSGSTYSSSSNSLALNTPSSNPSSSSSGSGSAPKPIIELEKTSIGLDEMKVLADNQKYDTETNHG